MKISSLMILCTALILGGCGTTGKNVPTEIRIWDNENCVINLSPDITTKSGDNPTTSDNTTDYKDLVKIPLADAMEQAIGADVIKEVTGKLGIDPAIVVPNINAEDPVPVVEINLIGTYSCKEYEDKSTCRTPVDFSKNDFPITFVFDNDCGSFTIPTAVSDNRNTDEYDRDGYVYFSYEKGSPAVFTPKGCVATSVSAYRTSL